MSEPFFRPVFCTFFGDGVVAKFFFHVGNGNELRDDAGMDLNSLKEAREEALLTVRTAWWRRPFLEPCYVVSAGD
jgi:hypothetical protein